MRHRKPIYQAVINSYRERQFSIRAEIETATLEQIHNINTLGPSMDSFQQIPTCIHHITNMGRSITLINTVQNQWERLNVSKMTPIKQYCWQMERHWDKHILYTVLPCCNQYCVSGSMSQTLLTYRFYKTLKPRTLSPTHTLCSPGLQTQHSTA